MLRQLPLLRLWLLWMLLASWEFPSRLEASDPGTDAMPGAAAEEAWLATLDPGRLALLMSLWSAADSNSSPCGL